MNTPAAIVGCAIVVLLEPVKWAVERVGPRRIPEVDLDEPYTAAPLDPRHRAIVGVDLALLPVLLVLLFRISRRRPWSAWSRLR